MVRKVVDWAGNTQLTRIDVVMGFLGLIFFIWLSIPTSIFIKPISYALTAPAFIESNTGHSHSTSNGQIGINTIPFVEYTRLTPLGSVDVYWSTEIIGPHGSCHDSGVVLFEDVTEPIYGGSPALTPVKFLMPEALQPCIVGGHQHIISQTLHAKVFGAVKSAWPVRRVWSCRGNGEDCHILE